MKQHNEIIFGHFEFLLPNVQKLIAGFSVSYSVLYLLKMVIQS